MNDIIKIASVEQDGHMEWCERDCDFDIDQNRPACVSFQRENEMRSVMDPMIKVPEPKNFEDLTYEEFRLSDFTELFPNLEDWQEESLKNWMELWQDNEIQPKNPYSQVQRMFASADVKADMERALAAEKIKPKVLVHTMSYDAHGSFGPGVYCTCGGKKVKARMKVLNTWAWRHFEKTGHEMKKAE